MQKLAPSRFSGQFLTFDPRGHEYEISRYFLVLHDFAELFGRTHVHQAWLWTRLAPLVRKALSP
jgi:hypothetical protein